MNKPDKNDYNFGFGHNEANDYYNDFELWRNEMSERDMCQNCNKKENELYEHQTVTDGSKENWCSDCMRRIDHCFSCDAHISIILLWYGIDEWHESTCPACNDYSTINKL